MSQPSKRTHDGMPLSHGEAATDAQPTRRQRRRKRGREREKARRGQSAHEQATPLTVAEKQLAVARAELLVEQLRLREQELKQQLTPSTQPGRMELSLPPTPNGQEVVLHTSRENRAPIVELFSSDSDDPPHPSPSRLPPISRGEKVFVNTSREGRVPIVEQFPSDFSDSESPEDPNLPSTPSSQLPSTLETQEPLQRTRPQKRTAVRGLLSSCVQVPSTQQDTVKTVPSCGPAVPRRKPMTLLEAEKLARR